MLRFAPAAFSRPTSLEGVCRLAAISAKAVSFVPINQAPRTTVKRQCFRPEQRGHFPHFWREDRPVGNVRVDLREGWAIFIHAQKNEVLRSTPRRQGSPGQLPIPALDKSEEHTSELQSLMRISYAVFCLKKKKTIKH